MQTKWRPLSSSAIYDCNFSWRHGGGGGHVTSRDVTAATSLALTKLKRKCSKVNGKTAPFTHRIATLPNRTSAGRRRRWGAVPRVPTGVKVHSADVKDPRKSAITFAQWKRPKSGAHRDRETKGPENLEKQLTIGAAALSFHARQRAGSILINGSHQ